ncbi:hypothetical protein COCNU_contig69356443G000010 [Cocos nucifera]|nr:hypothetical protein [Cocos nucifera]
MCSAAIIWMIIMMNCESRAEFHQGDNGKRHPYIFLYCWYWGLTIADYDDEGSLNESEYKFC